MSDGGVVIAEPAGGRPVDLAANRATAFRELVGAALDDAYRRAAVLLGDRFEAEDAVHDAAEKAWRGWSNLRDPGRFDAWFGRILLNTCRDRLRARRRVRRLEIRADSTPIVTAAPELAGVDDIVRSALLALGVDERIVVVLRYESDLTIPAIAALVGVPEGTVKSRLHNALRKLRESMEGTER